MSNNKITRENAPVGARLLVRDRHYYGNVHEITVLEWSPSGERVKYRPAANPSAGIWSEDLPKWGVLVEVLAKAEGDVK